MDKKTEIGYILMIIRENCTHSINLLKNTKIISDNCLIDLLVDKIDYMTREFESIKSLCIEQQEKKDK